MKERLKDVFINRQLFWIVPVSLILGIILALQYRVINENFLLGGDNIGASALYTRRYNELLQQKDLLEQQVDTLQQQLESLQGRDSENSIIENLNEEINYYRKVAGFTKVQGAGVVIDFKASEFDSDLNMEDYSQQVILLVNELNSAGAEAIAINEQRITAQTEIRLAGNALVVNGNPLLPPFIVKAIGDKDTLEAALSLRFGFIEQVRKNGYFIEVKKSDDVQIEAYPNKPEFNYAETVQ